MFWKRMIAAIAFVSMASSAYADEPLLDEFKKHFNTEAFKIGALVQAVGVHETGDSALTNNGFGITNFRICLRGELDEGWGYLLQTQFAKAPALLDASVRFHRWTALGFEAGAFIAPGLSHFGRLI